MQYVITYGPQYVKNLGPQWSHWTLNAHEAKRWEVLEEVKLAAIRVGGIVIPYTEPTES